MAGQRCTRQPYHGNRRREQGRPRRVLAAAMEQVPVPHVILTQAATLFPMPSRRFIGFVQKMRQDGRREHSP
jgi:hypothetical protein